MPTNQSLISVAQAAEILGVSIRTIQYRIARGDLTAQKLPGKTGAYILDRREVEAIAKTSAA